MPEKKKTPLKPPPKSRKVVPFVMKKGRPRGRPFKKGDDNPKRIPSSGSGRKKGTPNKLTTAYKEFLGALIDDPQVQQAVKNSILAGEWQPYFKAISQLHGMPKQEVDVGSSTIAHFMEMAIKAADRK